jgi:small multidrug resistance pump
VNYLYLAIAIILEIVATSFLKTSEGFTKLVPSVICAIGYAIAFYCMSLTLRTVPVGIAYAIWSGTGIAVIALIGWLVFKQALDVPGFLGITLILSGVIILNVFSKAAPH